MIVIVDPDASHRAQIELLLRRSEYAVIGCYDDVSELLRAEINPSPSIALVAVEDGPEAPLSISPLVDRGMRVIIMGDGFMPERILTALDGGAEGYLSKEALTPKILLDALKLISASMS